MASTSAVAKRPSRAKSKDEKIKKRSKVKENSAGKKEKKETKSKKEILSVAEVIGEHRELTSKLRERIKKSINKSASEEAVAEIKQIKLSVETLQTIIKCERLVWEIDGAVDEGEVDEREEMLVQMEFATAPSGAE